MAGTGASNLGYGNITPFGNVNGHFVNVTNSHNPSIFSSNQIPGYPGIAGTKSNIDAAAGIFNGGGYKRKNSSKRKNISKLYKHMKKMYSKKHYKNSRKYRKRSRRYRKKSRTQRGGYGQYQNNTPISVSYSTGGVLSPNNLALANPVPYQALSNSAIDNYDHYINLGSPSKNW